MHHSTLVPVRVAVSNPVAHLHRSPIAARSFKAWSFRSGRLAVLLIAFAFAPQRARAHDLWLIPDSDIAIGMPARVLANSGMEFPKSENAPDPAAFEKRLLLEPNQAFGQLTAAGQQEKSGVMQFVPKERGTYVIAVETRPKIINLDAADFNAYLVSDGLPHIYRLRAKENTLDQPARERYSKSPKALVQLGQGGGDPCRVLGLPLEIVPQRNPFELKVGDTLRVRVLFRGATLADANLGWDLPDDGEAASGTVRTDAQGDALIPVARSGLFTIRLTHMTRPKLDDYEWESFWTTLTFRVPR